MRWRRTLFFTVLLLFLSACVPSSGLRWQRAMRGFQAAGLEPAHGGVLFLGSSSVARWTSLAGDFPEIGIVNRGVSGSELGELATRVPQLVAPYSPSLIVVYAGDNDLARGKSPEMVLAAYQRFVASVRALFPEQRIVYLAIKPSPARQHLLARMRETNRLIAGYSLQDERLDYLDVFSPMLGTDGSFRPELYVSDGLHLSPPGYALWRELLSPYLQGVLTPS